MRLCPHGEVDLATIGAIRERVDEMTALGFRRVALDLRGVTFLDSTGVRLTLELREDALSEAGEFAVIRGPAPVQRIFELTGVRPLIPFIAPTQIRYASWSRA